MVKYHKLGGLLTTEIYFSFLEARSLRSWCQHDWAAASHLLVADS